MTPSKLRSWIAGGALWIAIMARLKDVNHVMALRTHLQTNDLKSYFEVNSIAFEDLLNLADTLYENYMTTAACDRARTGDYAHTTFVGGTSWTTTATGGVVDESQEHFIGDDTLANSILQMQDAMLHYEFQHAVADGDIGQAMNIMSVSKPVCLHAAINTHALVMVKGMDIYIHW